ncbi:MAG: phosphoribosylformylglycinamidine cyclo-ligase [Leptospiraceae bacterium]|nr:phosphoribosylformylglycinamidine cyclo-ligase [Leptospiraceae bacterium]
MDRKTITYRDSGVDTEAGQAFVKRITQSVKSTHNSNVLGPAAGFSAMYDASFLKQYDEPVIVSATDGVGTKLVLASLFDFHESVGIDLVAMCANDLLVGGAKAHFFLDYIATGKLDQDRMAAIVESISEGCRRCGCALVGGETAEHPDVMKADEYDLAGFVVGAVEKSKIIDGSAIKAGDQIIGLPSSGIHSNGLSLVRKLYLKDGALPSDDDTRTFLRDEILAKPTVLYEPIVAPLLKEYSIHGMVHVTGGGFYENVPRVLPDALAAHFQPWDLPAPFDRIITDSGLPVKEMHSTFNCGYGYLLVVPASNAESMLQRIQELWMQLPFDPGSDRIPQLIGTIRDRKSEAVVFEDAG